MQYVSAQTLTKLLDNFAAKPGMVRADPTRNLVVIQGSGEDRRAALDTMHSFDADWMRGQSVGIYPVRNTTPEPLIAELEKMLTEANDRKVRMEEQVGRLRQELDSMAARHDHGERMADEVRSESERVATEVLPALRATGADERELLPTQPGRSATWSRPADYV